MIVYTPRCLGACGVQIRESYDRDTANLIAQTHADVCCSDVEVTPVNVVVAQFFDAADWDQTAA